VTIALVGFTLYSATNRAREAGQAVGHTLEVLDEVSGAEESLSRADASQRGFVLTGEASFRADRDVALAETAGQIDKLIRLTADHALQQQRLRKLRAALDERTAIMHETSPLPAERDFEALRAHTRRGELASTRFYTIADEIRNEEKRLLELRRAAESRDHDQAILLLLLAAALSLSVMVPGYVGYILEARARTRAETKLLDMAHSLPGATYQLRRLRDGTRRFEFLSPSVESLRRVDRKAAMRDFAAMWETIVPDDRELLARHMAQAELDLGVVQYDFRVHGDPGQVRWLRASAFLRKDPDGTILWNGYWMDVTAEKELQRELHEARDAADSANRAKSMFLATMSHEIRTPMNGIFGMLELLALTDLSGEQRTALAVVRESSRSLLRIIDDILDFSKIEAGKFEVRPEPSSVAEVVHRVCNIYAGNASSKGLRLERHVDAAISPTLMVDPLRLQQVLSNFVSNAIKFTERGEVCVRADLVERVALRDTVRLTVTDTGIGISGEDSKRLFEPFSQVSGDASRRFGGTGLGLAICRRVAEIMGAEVTLSSELGTGTTLAITLTLERVEGGQGHAPPPALVESAYVRREASSVDDARRMRSLVLVVDDHPVNRMVLLKQVNTVGHAAVLAEDGVQALAKWREGGFGAVLTDCHMPVMDGYELARRIRADEAALGLARIPIIACTANAMAGEMDNCFAAGMDDYLAKPITMGQLQEKLDQWLHPRETGGDEAPLSRAALEELTGGDPAMRTEMLVRFMRHQHEDHDALARAIEQVDLEEVVHASHRMKGAARVIGAERLAAACNRVEAAGRGADWDGVCEAHEALKHEEARLQAYIEPELEARP
jgi:signal transduction histidine kinase/CheY-like chemotaxis protein/CHASE3 domain sensor protein/HPt (histidine-containing phosphotransfer) domain-containing protein